MQPSWRCDSKVNYLLSFHSALLQPSFSNFLSWNHKSYICQVVFLGYYYYMWILSFSMQLLQIPIHLCKTWSALGILQQLEMVLLVSVLLKLNLFQPQLDFHTIHQMQPWKIFFFILKTRDKSILELWITTLLPDWQPPLTFVWFTSK